MSAPGDQGILAWNPQFNFFHSSYLAGDTVLCTGSLLIELGVVKAIKNDSGHYQPTVFHLVNVVRTLQMHGVDVSQVAVKAVAGSWLLPNGSPATFALDGDGAEIIEEYGGGQGALDRMGLNQQNIQRRRAQTINRPPPS